MKQKIHIMKNCLLFFVAVCFSFVSQAQRPMLTSSTPTTGASQVLTTVPMTMSFNKPVSKGTGKIYLRNRTLKSTKTIAASSADVSVSGSFVTISNLGLIAGCYYHVTFDSTAFDSASYHSIGLYDTSTWWFRTGGVGVGTGTLNAPSLLVSLGKGATNGLFVISCTTPKEAMLAFRIYDINGREVNRQSLAAKPGNNELALQTFLPAGTYIITVDDGTSYARLKVIMQ